MPRYAFGRRHPATPHTAPKGRPPDGARENSPKARRGAVPSIVNADEANTIWRTIGHAKAVDTLRRSLEADKLSHAHLIAGPRHVGKMTLAIDLAMALCCTGNDRPCGECSQCSRIARGLHADLRVVGIETSDAGNGRSRVLIGIDQVREVQREASLTPFEGSHRVVIFEGAERLSEEAANSLLKFLEEPPDQVVLLLLTTDVGALPSTIVSRCQVLELRAVPPQIIARELEKTYRVDADAADEIARLSEGRPGWALGAAEDSQVLEGLSKKLDDIEDVVGGSVERRFAYAARLAAAFDRDRDPVRQELDLWMGWWRSVLLVKEGVPQYVIHLSRLDSLRKAAAALTSAQVARAIDAIGQSMTYLERNVSSRLTLEELMLALPRPLGLTVRDDTASRS